jgi:hypothetical protein
MPRFLPLARTGHRDSIRLLDHLWQRKESLSRLMVATKHVGGKDGTRAICQGWLDSGLTCRKRYLHPMPKAVKTHSNANISSPQSTMSNIPQSPLWQFNPNTRLTILRTSQPH